MESSNNKAVEIANALSNGSPMCYYDVRYFLNQHPRFLNAEYVCTLKEWREQGSVCKAWPFWEAYRYLGPQDICIFSLGDKYYAVAWYGVVPTYTPSVRFRRVYFDRQPPRRRNQRTYNIADNTIIDTQSREDNDCQVRCLAEITQRPYSEILKRMQQLGWSAKTPGRWEQDRIDAVLKAYGLKRVEVFAKKWNDKTVQARNAGKLIEQHHSAWHTVLVSGHVAAWKEGMLYDSWDSGRRLVLRIERIEPL